MDRKRATRRTTAVVAGSVWETRMMNDEIMGGFKVFNPTNPDEERKQRIAKQSPVVKRKTWKSGDSIQIGGSVMKKSPDSRNPIGNRKSVSRSIDFDRDGNEKSSNSRMKMGSNEIIERNKVHNRMIGDGNEKNLAQLAEMKTECANVIDKSEPLPNKGSDELRKIQIESETEKIALKQSVDESTDENEIVGRGSNLAEEKSVSRALINVGNHKSVSGSDHKNVILVTSNEEGLDEKIVARKEKESIEELKLSEQKPKEIVNHEKKLIQIKEKPLPSSSIVKKQSPNLVNYSRNISTQTKAKAIPEFDRFQSHRVPQTHGKLQSLIDLVMWKDASRSAFIFGIGTFIIISSSYTKDLNFSLISGFSYLGLGCLAAIFIFRPIISRGTVDISETSEEYIVGEEEAVWLLKMVLPYLNEFLIKIKALFSGDPATTLKMGVMLFVLARCGSSITIWKMAKLGFFGVFTVPKICSSYSTQLTAYGKFWVRRFKDAWESCTHKKAVGFGVFTLVWNLSSVVARIWAVFMLFVAFKYYQQSMATDDNDDDCVAEEKPKFEPSRQGLAGVRRLKRGIVESTPKEKKFF